MRIHAAEFNVYRFYREQGMCAWAALHFARKAFYGVRGRV